MGDRHAGCAYNAISIRVQHAERRRLRNAAAVTSTVARPTKLWKAATSCGIAVNAMRRAARSHPGESVDP